MPRLPKEVETHPRADALSEHLANTAGPLADGLDARVPVLPVSAAIAAALVAARADGRLVRGLTGASRALRDEKRGMDLSDERTGTVRQPRISRLLLLSSDGSKRFYRDAAMVLSHHADRLLVVRLETDEAELGSRVFGAGEVARALLVKSKAAVRDVLLALAPPEAGD